MIKKTERIAFAIDYRKIGRKRKTMGKKKKRQKKSKKLR